MVSHEGVTGRTRRLGRWRSALVVGLGLGLGGLACGVAIKRDLTAIPVGQIGYEDTCGLQQYFDTMAAKRVQPPRIVSGNELEGERQGKAVHGGHSRFAFETDFQVRTVRRLLEENWQRLPEGLDKATRIDLDVYWSEVYGLRRVVTERDAQLYVGQSNEPVALPYHVCLSELLFGEPIYKERRSMLNLAPLPSVLGSADGGVADAGAIPAALGAGGAGPSAPAMVAPTAGMATGSTSPAMVPAPAATTTTPAAPAPYPAATPVKH